MSIRQGRKLAGSGEAANLGASRAFGPITVSGRQLSIVASWTGTPTGTFALETLAPDGSWKPVPGAGAEFVANGQLHPGGGASSAVWTWSNVPGSQLRLAYAHTSGTGVFTATSTQSEV